MVLSSSIVQLTLGQRGNKNKYQPSSKSIPTEILDADAILALLVSERYCSFRGIVWELNLHARRTNYTDSKDPRVHYNDVMSMMASQITSLAIVYSIVYSMCRSKKTSKLRVIGLCEGNSAVIGEFPAQRASNAENVSIWWRHHVNIRHIRV